LIADADPNVSAALRLLLARHHADFTLIGESRNAQELLRQTFAGQADVILLDWELRGLHADDDLVLRNVSQRAVVIVLSTHDEHCARALEAGATALVCKGDSPSRLMDVLREVESMPQCS
jgi:DNA-binding NarL/FixJ family response regulator